MAQAPVVLDGAFLIEQNGWLRASAIVSATDPDGNDTITTYQFIDTTTVAGSSYF